MQIFETIFDVVYLCGVVTLGIIILRISKEKQYRLFGIMAIVLGFGDAFHLVPRILALNTPNGFEQFTAFLGYGQFITGITMTLFYVLIFFIWKIRYNKKHTPILQNSIFALALARIIFCCLPQNQWASNSSPLFYGILRNIPFAIMGIIIIVIFYKEARSANDKDFKFMWLAIVLSFAFYVPVVLFAGVFPPIGALMMPKTLAYVWIVMMGYSAARKA